MISSPSSRNRVRFSRAQHLHDLGEITAERLARLGRQRDLVAVAPREAAEAVPLGLVLPAVAVGQLGGEQRLHRRQSELRLGHWQTIAWRLQSFPLRGAAQGCYAGGPRGRNIGWHSIRNAATAKYIDSLGPAALQKAHDYTVGKEWMLLWSLLVAAVVTWLIVRSGVLDRLDAQLRQSAAEPRAFVISLVYLVVSTRPHLAVDHLCRLVA